MSVKEMRHIISDDVGHAYTATISMTRDQNCNDADNALFLNLQ